MSEPIDFATKVAQKKAELEARKALAAPPTVDSPAEQFAQDAPDVTGDRSEDDIEMDRVIDTIDIIPAYIQWCGKMTPEVKGGQTEGIMISCPIPGHADKKPSAWINTKTQTWYCGGCQVGGDKYDLAAYKFGFPSPGYKEGAKFHELRRLMAESMGWTKQTYAGGISVMVPPTPAPVLPPPPPANPQNKSEPEVEGQTATVTALDPLLDLFEEDKIDIDFPSIAWREIVPPDTFLNTYMETCSKDDVPEEYHFWNGLLAIGLALGKDVSLFDRIPVYGNLFVCTIGHSGSGKSQARYHLDRLLSTALPVDRNNIFSKGVEKVSSPGSAEALINTFQRPIIDPANPKVVMGNAPVRGLVDFNELSSLVSRANRMGNALKPTLMQFYDMEGNISTVSMTTGKKTAEHPFASALTTTQPRALKSLLSTSDIDSGFLNRWVFAAGPSKTRVAIGGAMIDITPCVKPLQEIHGYCGFGFTMDWDEQAHFAFTELYHTYIEPIKLADDAGLLTRLDLTAKKLCLLLTANQRLRTVPVHVVHQVALICKYITACYGIGGAEIGNSLQQQVRTDVVRVVEHHAKKSTLGASLRDINRYLSRKKYPLDVVVKTLDYMVKLGELDISKTQGPGRPTIRYVSVG